MSYSRKMFLKTIGWATLGLSLPVPVFSQSNKQGNTQGGTATLQAMLVQAKELYLNKEYDKAHQLYVQMVEAFPTKIQGYDGVARGFKRRHELVGAAEVYRSGLQHHATHAVFYHRFGVCLRQIALGNHVLDTSYQSQLSTTSIYKESIYVLQQGLVVSPENKVLQRSLTKTVNEFRKRKIHTKSGRELAETLEPSMTSHMQDVAPVKLSKNGKPVRNRKKGFENVDVEHFLVKIKKKKAKANASPMQRRQWQALEARALAELNKRQLNRYMKELRLQFDEFPTSNSFGLLKNHLYKKEKYAEVIELCEQFCSVKQDAWSQLGLASAYLRCGLAKRRKAWLANGLAEYERLWNRRTTLEPQLFRLTLSGYCKALLSTEQSGQINRVLALALQAEQRHQKGVMTDVCILSANYVERLGFPQVSDEVFRLALGLRTQLVDWLSLLPADDKAWVSQLKEIAPVKKQAFEPSDIALLHAYAAFHVRNGEQSQARQVYQHIVELQPADRAAQKKIKTS